jgi:hypothetical protein
MPEISTETTPTAAALDWVPIPAEIVRWADLLSSPGRVSPPLAKSTRTTRAGSRRPSAWPTSTSATRPPATPFVASKRPGYSPSIEPPASLRRTRSPAATVGLNCPSLVDLDAGPMAAYCSLYLAGTFESALPQHHRSKPRRLAGRWASHRTPMDLRARGQRSSETARRLRLRPHPPATTPAGTPAVFGRQRIKDQK